MPGVPSLPQSNLPPAHSSSSVDPTHPTGIIPSTGNSVYDLDVAMFEGSGQLWRRPGSDLSDWFNYGFDEVSYPKFLRFRAEMEAGRNAMVGRLSRA
jgi:pre-mRNA 3'-end-processing factor FIP1